MLPSDAGPWSLCIPTTGHCLAYHNLPLNGILIFHKKVSRQFIVCSKDHLRPKKYMSMDMHIQINQQPKYQRQNLPFTPLYFLQTFSYYLQ